MSSQRSQEYLTLLQTRQRLHPHGDKFGDSASWLSVFSGPLLLHGQVFTVDVRSGVCTHVYTSGCPNRRLCGCPVGMDVSGPLFLESCITRVNGFARTAHVADNGAEDGLRRPYTDDASVVITDDSVIGRPSAGGWFGGRSGASRGSWPGRELPSENPSLEGAFVHGRWKMRPRDAHCA